MCVGVCSGVRCGLAGARESGQRGIKLYSSSLHCAVSAILNRSHFPQFICCFISSSALRLTLIFTCPPVPNCVACLMRPQSAKGANGAAANEHSVSENRYLVYLLRFRCYICMVYLLVNIGRNQLHYATNDSYSLWTNCHND